MRTLSREEAKRQAQALKAMGHPARLRIVRMIGSGECCVTELVQEIRLSWASVSRHLAVLRAAGILADRRAGLRIYYKVAWTGALDVAEILDRTG